MDERIDLWVRCRAAGRVRQPALGLAGRAQLVPTDLGGPVAARGDRPVQASMRWPAWGVFVGFWGGVGVGLRFLAPRCRQPRSRGHQWTPSCSTSLTLTSRGTFTVGSSTLDVHAARTLIVPATVAHAFVNSGETRLKQVDIHLSPKFITEWL